MGEECGQHLPMQPPDGRSCGVGEGEREKPRTPKEYPPKNTDPDPPQQDQVQPPVLDATPLSTTHQNGLDTPLQSLKIIRTSRAGCIPEPPACQMPTH